MFLQLEHQRHFLAVAAVLQLSDDFEKDYPVVLAVGGGVVVFAE